MVIQAAGHEGHVGRTGRHGTGVRGKRREGQWGPERMKKRLLRAAREIRWFAGGGGRSWVGVTARRVSVMRAEMEAWGVCAWLTLFFLFAVRRKHRRERGALVEPSRR